MNLALIQPTEFARLLQGSQARRLIAVINVLLVIWIAAQLAGITWDLFPGPDSVDQAVSVNRAPAARAEANPDRQLIAGLPAWHLLGVPARDAGPAVVAAPEDAPDTQLRLTLRGALASGDRELARAIIADQSGNDEQYAIGSMLPGNAELSEIYPDRVILKRNGRYETLRLPDESRPEGGAPVTSAYSLSRASSGSPAERLRELRQQMQNKPKALFELVQPSQKRDDAGNVIGYQIKPGTNAQLFEQTGLQDGDVIVEVNGLAMSDTANGPRALQSLRDGEPVTVKLLRDGQEQTLTLDTGQ